jgi:hypothetical protein
MLFGGIHELKSQGSDAYLGCVYRSDCVSMIGKIRCQPPGQWAVYISGPKTLRLLKHIQDFVLFLQYSDS